MKGMVRDMFGPHYRPAFGWGGSEEPDGHFEGPERPTIDEQIGYHWGPRPFHRPFHGPFGRPFFGGPFFGRPFHHMMRRGPFNFGGGPRMFGRGDLKYALLGLLQEHPKHGYEMIKDLEDRSGGFYSPSAGAIYPTLQLLEDRGWVSVEVIEGKKVYTISDEGRKALAEYQERSSGFPFGGPGFGPGFGPHGHHGGHQSGHHGGRQGERAERDERRERERGPRGRGPWGDPRRGPWDWEVVGPELRALAHEGRDIARMMREAVMLSARDPERLKELRSMVERVRGELLTFISQRPDSQPNQSDQPQQSDQPDQPGQSGGEGPVEHL